MDLAVVWFALDGTIDLVTRLVRGYNAINHRHLEAIRNLRARIFDFSN